MMKPTRRAAIAFGIGLLPLCVVLGLQKANAQPSKPIECVAPKSLGAFKTATGNAIFFEDLNGTISALQVNLEGKCTVELRVRRQ